MPVWSRADMWPGRVLVLTFLWLVQACSGFSERVSAGVHGVSPGEHRLVLEREPVLPLWRGATAGRAEMRFLSIPVATDDSTAASSSLWVSVGEVDQATWRLVAETALQGRVASAVGTLAHGTCPQFGGMSLVSADSPMVCLNICDAVLFANELSLAAGLSQAYFIPSEMTFSSSPTNCGQHLLGVSLDMSANGFRLPTRAEWESIARISGLLEASGDVSSEDEEGRCIGNVRDSAFFERFDRPGGPALDPVAPCDDSFPVLGPAVQGPSSISLASSLAGNVSEWVWEPQEQGVRPAGSSGPLDRAAPAWVIGGNWQDLPPSDLLDTLMRWESSRRTRVIGVRLVRPTESAVVAPHGD